MSSGRNSGVTNGGQMSFEQQEAQRIAAENEERVAAQLLISELESKGIKFTKENVVFITRDRTGQIVWLETGTVSAGLNHILSRHENDFKSKHNIGKDKIKGHLKNVFSNGVVMYSRITVKNGQKGLEKLYLYKGNYYLLSGVGTNGFIVSAYPIDSNTALKLNERYGK